MANILSDKVHSGLLESKSTVSLDNIDYNGLTWSSMSVERLRSGSKSKTIQVILRYSGERTNELYKVSISVSSIRGTVNVSVETPWTNIRKVESDGDDPDVGIVGPLDLKDVILEIRSYLRAM